MLRLEGAKTIVNALDAKRLEIIRLNNEGTDGAEYYAEILTSGYAIIPFADQSIEIYDETEWRKA